MIKELPPHPFLFPPKPKPISYPSLFNGYSYSAIYCMRVSGGGTNIQKFIFKRKFLNIGIWGY